MLLTIRISVAVAEISVSVAVVEISVFIAVAEISFDAAVAIIAVIAVEATGEALRLRELVLWRGVEAVLRGEVWVDSGGTLVADGFSVAKKPGGVVGLLHDMCCGRGGWASQG